MESPTRCTGSDVFYANWPRCACADPVELCNLSFPTRRQRGIVSGIRGHANRSRSADVLRVQLLPRGTQGTRGEPGHVLVQDRIKQLWERTGRQRITQPMNRLDDHRDVVFAKAGSVL